MTKAIDLVLWLVQDSPAPVLSSLNARDLFDFKAQLPEMFRGWDRPAPNVAQPFRVHLRFVDVGGEPQLLEAFGSSLCDSPIREGQCELDGLLAAKLDSVLGEVSELFGVELFGGGFSSLSEQTVDDSAQHKSEIDDWKVSIHCKTAAWR